MVTIKRETEYVLNSLGSRVRSRCLGEAFLKARIVDGAFTPDKLSVAQWVALFEARS